MRILGIFVLTMALGLYACGGSGDGGDAFEDLGVLDGLAQDAPSDSSDVAGEVHGDVSVDDDGSGRD